MRYKIDDNTQACVDVLNSIFSLVGNQRFNIVETQSCSGVIFCVTLHFSSRGSCVHVQDFVSARDQVKICDMCEVVGKLAGVHTCGCLRTPESFCCSSGMAPLQIEQVCPISRTLCWESVRCHDNAYHAMTSGTKYNHTLYDEWMAMLRSYAFPIVSAADAACCC